MRFILDMIESKFLRITIITTSLFLSSNIPATYAQTIDEISERGVLKVGVLLTYPPFGSVHSSGEPEGYDPSLARLLAETMDVDVEFVPAAVQNRIPYLMTGQVDILIAALGITPERAEQINFSQPSASVERILYSTKELDIGGMDDLSGVRVAVTRSSPEDLMLTNSAAGVVVARFDDDPSAVQAFISGQADALVTSDLIVAELAERTNVDNFEVKFTIQRLIHGIGVRKGSDELLAWINDFLTEAKSNGELNKLHLERLGTEFLGDE